MELPTGSTVTREAEWLRAGQSAPVVKATCAASSVANACSFSQAEACIAKSSFLCSARRFSTVTVLCDEAKCADCQSAAGCHPAPRLRRSRAVPPVQCKNREFGKPKAVKKTLFLSPPSFDGFDGGAGARYQAKREITSYWFPTWLAQPAALVPGRKLMAAPPHHQTMADVLAIANDYKLFILHTSPPPLPHNVHYP